MSDQETTEFEVREVSSYPDPTVGPKKFLIIEYKVIKKEINRYNLVFGGDKGKCT